VHYHRSQAEAMQLVDQLNAKRPDSARALPADLTRADQVQRLAKEARQAFKRLDVLVNNASSFYPTAFGSSTTEQWDDLVDSNLRAAYFLSQSLRQELLSRRGAIVNLVDTHADRSLPGYPIYSIAKAGVKAMTHALATELAPHVRVNGVSPGAILWPPALQDDSDPVVLEKRTRALAGIPLGALGKAQDIADLVCFLALEADYVTGQVIKVDGGRSLN
jgi:pteridine reductase